MKKFLRQMKIQSSFKIVAVDLILAWACRFKQAVIQDIHISRRLLLLAARQQRDNFSIHWHPSRHASLVNEMIISRIIWQINLAIEPLLQVHRLVINTA